MKRKIYLFIAWLHEYFKHPLQNVRTADYIVPKRLYDNFGNVCICVPHTHGEHKHLQRWPDRALPLPLLLQAYHSPEPLHELDNMYSQLYNKIKTDDIPAHCNFAISTVAAFRARCAITSVTVRPSAILISTSS